MQIYHIKTDEQGKELTVHGSNDFPCAVYDEKFSEFLNGEVPWHWHQEIEIVLVVAGATKLECIGSSDVVTQGDVILVNSGALHKLTNESAEDCHILNVVFDPKLLGGAHFSRIYQKYVSPIIHNAEFTFFKFSASVEWQQQVISILKQAFVAWQHTRPGYELILTQSLMQCWQLLCENQPNLLVVKQVSPTKEKRIQTMLQFIHCHFTEDISVQAIGQSANISASECFRLFRTALHSTPNGYLLNYRLRHASSLLLETNLPITDVAQQSGFNCSAYFGKKFRAAYQRAPKQYRVQV
ncbi:helix-turn-helix domain-containing protein [Vibrio taketomensis]|uniref:AraC family transcriptional regulator n=1 Tax=Vibrio taketomensis TaxID=2572923 RepID=UPI001389C000|nr:AraC family transcriptional regulator [Vibrio taketomensis]